MDYSKMTEEQFAEELCDVVRNGASISDVMYLISEYTKDLRHYKDSTVGLWATDRPDLIIDKSNIMFQLTE